MINSTDASICTYHISDCLFQLQNPPLSPSFLICKMRRGLFVTIRKIGLTYRSYPILLGKIIWLRWKLRSRNL